ncbi:MAG: hypothetical protein NW241_22760 [Bacteroidia bacterium]|nr:hypothetical protein [Bacteroidia bacterium]
MRSAVICWLLLAVLAARLPGQDHCGQAGLPPNHEARLRLAAAGALRSDTLYQIPAVFHLAARSDGGSQTPSARVLQALCELNAQFRPAGIRFFLAPQGIRQVRSTGIFSQHHLSASQQAMRSLKADSALNIFVVQNAGPAGESGVTGYFDPGDDWLVLRRDMLRSGNKTLAHECGHFFGLLHPHFGWDAQARTQAGPAPALASDGVTATERMDGSNCQTAGDQLCDTPPDYNNGLGWQQSCQYAGPVQDPAGQPLDPDETLIMSYFNDSCRAVFSPQQQALMRAGLSLPDRAHLRGQTPGDTLPAGQPVLLLPADTVRYMGDSIRFSWHPAAGAAGYIVEADRSASFSLDPQEWLLADTSAWLAAAWLPNQTYYWRVWAYHPGHTCTPASPVQTFVPAPVPAGLDPAAAPPAVRVWQDGRRLHLQLLQPVPANGALILSDLSGRVLMRQGLIPQAAPQTLAWDLGHLAPGWYFLRVQGGKSMHVTIQLR